MGKKYRTLIRCIQCGQDRHSYGTRFCSKTCYANYQSGVDPKVSKALSESDTIIKPMPELLQIDSSWIFVIGDVHAPIHSLYWCTRLCELAEQVTKTRGAKPDLLINGDLWDHDFISRFGGIKLEETLEQCHISVGNLLYAFSHVFNKIYLVQGNHDDRFSRAFDGLSFLDLVSVTLGKVVRSGRTLNWDQFIATERGYCFINDDWAAVHPRRYSKIRLKIAAEYADHFERHVITNHEHHPAGFTMDKKNRYFALNCPAMIDKAKCAYSEILPNPAYPEWANGFIELIRQEDETGWNFYHEKTNWEKLLYGKNYKKKTA